MSRKRAFPALLGAVALAFAACSGGATPSPSPTPTAPPASTAPAASPSPAPSPTPVTGSIGIGYPSNADSGDTPSILALNRLNDAGWTIKPTFFAQPETDFAAVAKGDIQIALGSTSAAFAAIQAGGKFHIIAKQEGVAWYVIAVNDIKTCDDIVGKRWALHSPAGTTTAYAAFWIASNCSADAQSKIKPIYIPGSENREAALQAGQIDATLLDSETWADLQTKMPGKFHALADLAADPVMGGLIGSVISVNDDYWNQHPEVVVAYLKALMKAYADAKADPTILDAAAASQNVQWSDTVRAGVALELQSGSLDPALAITPDSINLSLQFFTKYGSMQPGLTVDQVANFDPLKQASGS